MQGRPTPPPRFPDKELKKPPGNNNNETEGPRREARERALLLSSYQTPSTVNDLQSLKCHDRSDLSSEEGGVTQTKRSEAGDMRRSPDAACASLAERCASISGRGVYATGVGLGLRTPLRRSAPFWRATCPHLSPMMRRYQKLSRTKCRMVSCPAPRNGHDIFTLVCAGRTKAFNALCAHGRRTDPD